MSEVNLTDEIIRVLSVVAQRHGLETGTLSADSVPMTQIAGIDSLHAIEVLVELAATVAVPEDNYVFWDQAGKLKSIGAVAEILSRLPSNVASSK
jgi:plasmid stability protein